MRRCRPTATLKDLGEIGKTYADLQALNRQLAPYQISVARIPRKGWRSMAIRGESGTAQTLINWFGLAKLERWFSHTQDCINEINKLAKE